MSRMAPDDAQAYWLASKTHSDQFLLFAFDAVGWGGEALIDGLLERARRIPDLNLSVTETAAALDFPHWTVTRADRCQFAVRHADEIAWTACLDDVAALIGAQLDPRVVAWRVHLYSRVDEAPDGGAPVSVAVLQISHALADGRGATALARKLFGSGSLPEPIAAGRRRGPLAAAARGLLRLPMQLGGIVFRGRAAYRLNRREPSTTMAVAPGLSNVAPGDDRELRCIVVDADRLRIGSHSVTVGAIVAVADALAEFQVVAAGSRVVVELMMARSENSLSRNNFHTAGIDARIDLRGSGDRADAIARSIDDARRRDASPARVAARHAAAATPAMLMRLGATAFDPATRSSSVTGHTVVSSVNRGAADLVLGAGTVRFTAGFPALSTMQGLTHGIHGIGSTVTISVVTSRLVVPEVERYMSVLAAAVGRLPVAE